MNECLKGKRCDSIVRIMNIEQSIFIIIREYRFYWNWSHFRSFSDINQLIVDVSMLFIP